VPSASTPSLELTLPPTSKVEQPSMRPDSLAILLPDSDTVAFSFTYMPLVVVPSSNTW
jgi:hypothetical protein